ncbi:MAG: hypothetical protein IMX00_04875 [Limnochordales bacterium]|nr:hypothetical protein [Limnochordales bacterium]
MSNGFPFPGEVQVIPSAGAPGTPVRIEIRLSDDAPPISRVEAEVVGYGIRYPIYGAGRKFAADVQVPHEAPPGRYQIIFSAYTPSGEASQGERVEFTVI